MKLAWVILLVANLGLAVFQAAATTFYVNLNNPTPVSPFANWSTAATNIQDAIDASSDGDQILVTNGVYQAGGTVMAGNLTNRVALNKAVTVQSVNGPWVTIIQALGVANGASAVRCAWLTNGATLIGFTLQGGGTRAPSADDNVASGGGAWCMSSSAVIANCVIQSNGAYGNGAVFQGTLNNSLLRRNSVNNGAVYGASVVNCTVVSNAGYGIYSCRSTNCIAAYNAVGNLGGIGNIFSYSCTPSAAGGVGNIIADPQLQTDGFHLASTSPCIGAGTNLANGTDLDGNTWNNPPSIGCEEWQPFPVIITQPYYQVFSDSRSLRFNVSTAGQPPFSYYWFKDGNLVQDNGHYTNSNTANLVVSSYGTQDSGNYFVIASNLFGMATSQVAQVVIHCVDATGTNPVAPYSTWSTAATNIQDAVNAASVGEIVLVTNGIYTSGGKVMAGDLVNRVAIDKAVLVQSINGSAVTTIQGGGIPNGLGAIRCVWMTNGATLYGFTIQGGATRTNGDNTALQSGGGVYCSSAQSFVANCLIISNSAYYNGGGAYSGNLRNCSIYGNTIIGSPNLFPNGRGGGAYMSVMNNCTVIGNWSSGIAGGTEGGIFTNCIVYSNSSVVSSSPGNPSTNYEGGTWTYSCAPPLPSGIGNMSTDPLMFSDNVHLTGISPCRGAGTNVVNPADIFGNSWSNPPSMGCAEWVPAPYAVAPAMQMNNSGKLTIVVPVSGQPPFVCWWTRNGVRIGDGGDFSSANTTGLVVNNLTMLVGASFRVVVSNSYGVVTSPASTFSVHCVDAVGTNAVVPYLSWDTAATNIQDAITVSAVGDLVLVTNGLYATGGKSVDGVITNRVVVDKAIFVQSVNGSSLTTIQGAFDSTSTNGPGAIRCAWLTNNAILSGFTIRGGATRGITLSPNQTMDGGGVLGSSTSASVYNCLISTNYASYIGGGVYQVTLNQCTVIGNHAVGSGRAGSGVANAGSGGGAVNCNLNNCFITSNFADQSNAGGAQNCNATNCAFAKNRAYLYGSGAYQGTLVNCTLNNNTSGGYGSYGGAAASATLINCIVYGNFNIGSGSTNYVSCTFSYSDTYPLPAGTGNQAIDPQLLADGTHLATASPCIGAGTPNAVTGTDIDGQTWNNPPSIGCDEWQPATVICAPPTYSVSFPDYVMTFNVIVAGQAPFNYFWFKDGALIQDDENHTNSNTANLVVKNLRSVDAGTYQVVISNAMGAASSGLVSVSVAYAPTIANQPAYVRAAVGSTANINVGATGIAPFGYEWFTSSGRPATATPNVSGGSVLSANVIDPGMGYVSTPQVHIVGGSGSGASATATLLGGTVLKINISFPGFGYTAASPTIQIDPPPSIITPLPIQTNAILTLPAVIPADGTNYLVVITNNYGSVTSSTVLMTVFLPPQNFSASNTFGVNGNMLSLQLSGTPNYPYTLQTATNLMPPINWKSFLTNYADSNGKWSFTVSNLSAPNLYYRAVGQ